MNWALAIVPLLQSNLGIFFSPKNLLGLKKNLTVIEKCDCITKINICQNIKNKMTKSPKHHDFNLRYLRECPGELHVLGGRVAALQEPRPAVYVHQALVVVIVDGWA